MVTKTYKSGCTSGRAMLHGVIASVLALLAFVMCAPQLALAEESTQTIDGTMTIALLDGGAGASALGKAGTATGDALMWLILGVAVLIAGALYVFIKSRSLATNTGAHANVDVSSKKKTIVVAVVAALIACMCFGMYANKGVAFAKDTLSDIFGSSAVVVDNDGNVVSNAITVVNDEDEAIVVKSIQAPADLSDWNADIKDKTIESGAVAEGAWDGKTIPATLLEQLKNNDGYAELTFTINIEDTKTPLNFEEFYVETEGFTYTGKQITPVVSSLVYGESDFEVIYGENINAGEGSVTIKGIGDYKGEKTYTFTIGQKDPDFNIPNNLTAEEGETLADVALPTYENGTLVWNEPDASVGNNGDKNEFKATFIPADAKNYKTKEVTITVIVGKKVAFAVFSEKDGSLTFYKDLETNVPAVGIDYKGKPATSVYEGIESAVYSMDSKPEWCNDHDNAITKVEVADKIAPISTAFWFYDTTALNSVDLSKLKTSNVTNMHSMFYNSGVSSLDLSTFDTSSVENMSNMFTSCQNLASVKGLSSWETSKVTDMSYMFLSCGALTFDSKTEVAGWDTSNVKNMSHMFCECSKLEADCTSWDVKKVTDRTNFNNYAEGVEVPEWYEGFAVYSANDNSLNFYKDTTANIEQAKQQKSYRGSEATEVYTGIESTNYDSYLDTPWNAHAYDITEVNVVDDYIAPKSTAYWIDSFYDLQTADVAKLDTSQVTTMKSMFGYCFAVRSIGDVSQWDTSQVTDMSSMFEGCYCITVDCSNWTVDNVTNHDYFSEVQTVTPPVWV